MDAMDVLAKAREALGAHASFGEPIISNGVTIVPVTRVSGGWGGGSGTGPAPAGEAGGAGAPGQVPSGGGVGFGMGSAPAGVFVVREGNVSWRPAVDVNRVILRGQLVMIVALLTLRSLVKARVRLGRRGRRH